jgi:endonuclease-3
MKHTTRSARLLRLIETLEDFYGVPHAGNNALALQTAPDNSTDSINECLLDELVGTILSQNTSDTNSSRAFHTLKTTFPTWELVLNASTEAIAEAIRLGGLADQKAERIQTILRTIHAERGSITIAFLQDMNDNSAMQYLCGFKGVGIKTAACVLMFGLGRALCPVDTHVHRVLNRVGVVHAHTPDATFEALHKEIEDMRITDTTDTTAERRTNGYSQPYSLHVNAIRLGKNICTARKAHCERCPLAEICNHAASER